MLVKTDQKISRNREAELNWLIQVYLATINKLQLSQVLGTNSINLVQTKGGRASESG